MFFVSGTKIYLGTFDADMKAYPECKLVKQPDGTIVVVKQSTGTPTKPAHRRVCSLTELIARFGGAAVEAKEPEPEPEPEPEQEQEQEPEGKPNKSASK